MGVLLRALRTLVPVGGMILTGALQANPKLAWTLPVIAATGKGLRDTWPNNKVINFLPF